MKALRWFAKKNIKVTDAEKPVPGKDEVLIKVKSAGICGTDLHEYEAGPIFIPVDPHPITGMKAPITLGHEFSGEIVEVGKEVKGWKKGDRVTADACITCGECYYCKNGLYNLCDGLGFNGLASDGAFADYMKVPAYQLHRLDDRMSFEEGALIEPIAVGVHAIRKGKLLIGESVAIVGAGTIGLASLQAAKAAGASKVFVIEVAEARKKFAEKLGADTVIDPTKADSYQEIIKLNGGQPVDLAVECVGMDATLKEALKVTKKGGRIVVAGIFSAPTNGIEMNDIVIGEKEIIGTIGYKDDFNPSIALVASGAIKAKDLITSIIGIDEIIEKGFKELIENKNNHIKILVNPEK